jgi:signal transduction histidine kinase/DNA-binding response OmpR family regulator
LLALFKKYTLIQVHEKNNLLIEHLEKEKEEELHQLKLTFFTNISHEFKTPLTLILGPLEKMVQTNKFDEETNLFHQLMYRNAIRLKHLTEQILEFRRVEQGKEKLQLENKNVINAIKEIHESFTGLANQLNIRYQLFSETDRLDCWFDSDILEKTISNLLSNAFKFTEPGGEISILVSLITNNEQTGFRKYFEKHSTPAFNHFLKILVKDSGKGIENDKLDLIFTRFYQGGEGQLNKTNGSGIGLALTKSLVELHFGKIWAESEPGLGSRFYILLPVIESRQKINNPNVEFVAASTGVAKVTKVKPEEYIELFSKERNEIDVSAFENESRALVLLVEDSNDVKEFIIYSLGKKFCIIKASNGAEALNIAQQVIPDIVVSDVMMPVMDGIELCKLIKEDETTCHIPVILLTAKTTLEYKIEGFNTGADDYITKPFEISLLEARIDNLLAIRTTLRQKYAEGTIPSPKNTYLKSADDKFMEKLIELCNENISNFEFDVEQFSGHLGTSRSVMYRKVKSLTGMPVKDFLKVLRLKRAAQLLSQGNLRVSEISYEVGFTDPKYFSKCFKEKYNLTPKEYQTQKI